MKIPDGSSRKTAVWTPSIHTDGAPGIADILEHHPAMAATHKMNIFESPHVAISVDHHRHILEWRWTAHFAPSKQLRTILQNACPALRTHGLRRWLLDHTHMKVVGPEDQEWIVTTWLPSWITDVRPEARCRVAVVQSHDHFGKLSTLRICQRIMARMSGLSLEVFEDTHTAEAWLEQQNSIRMHGGGNG